MKHYLCLGKVLALLLCLFLVDECLSENCGVVNHIPNHQREIGGEVREAQQGAWPWLASIAIRTRNGTFQHACTAVLITKRHLLSAAHCFNQRSPSLYASRIGHVNRNLADEYKISEIAIPPTYKRGKYYDDIAVLTLSRDVNTENASPICLPPGPAQVLKNNLEGEIITSAGWMNKLGGPSGIMLEEIPAINVMSNRICNDLYKSKLPSLSRVFPQGFTDGIICAEFVGDKRKSCAQNSGSPLMYQEKGRWYVAAVSVFGVGGCVNPSNLPEGYTRVDKYLSWILQNIKT